jgi:hypothetical protein
MILTRATRLVLHLVGGCLTRAVVRWADEAIAVSDRVIAEALAGLDGLESLSEEVLDDGQRFSLPWIICHLIEEYGPPQRPRRSSWRVDRWAHG